MITSNTAGFSCESNLFCASCGAAVYDNAQRVRETADIKASKTEIKCICYQMWFLKGLICIINQKHDLNISGYITDTFLNVNMPSKYLNTKSN